MSRIKIIHIADIHWRGLSRHDEYRQVFSRMFKQVKELKPDVIYVGGDIVHSKTQGISPEIIDCLTWWFDQMAKICPVHTILGNHDGIMHNHNRQDAISPIINAMNNSKIHLYKKSGTYPTGIPGFKWCVFSCFDEKNWKNVEPSEGDVNLALFHGAVWGSKTDVEWSVEGDVDVPFFDKFDFALLGDIHKAQFLNDEKTIAYCGSTIQQNYGETQDKGFLLWDIKDASDFNVEFHRVAPVNPFVTIDWKGSIRKTLDNKEIYQDGSKFRIRSDSSIPQVEINQIQNELRKRYSAKEIVFKIDDASRDRVINTGSMSLAKKDLRDASVQCSLLREHIGNNTLVEKEWQMVDKMIIEYIRRASSEESVLHNIKWNIKKIAFDNMFSYGEGNIIDFEKLHGITGIFARNRMGKSAIAGSIMYSLFNTTDRGSIKNLHIINARKDFCFARADIKINSENYCIERQSVRYENRKGEQHATTTLALNKTDEIGNKTEDLSAEQRTVTEKILRKNIGTAEDFLLTSLSSQGEMNRFIQCGATNRKKILNKFLDLEIFDKMLEYSKEDSAYIRLQLKNAPDRDWSTVIKEKNETMKVLDSKIAEKQDRLIAARTNLQKLKSKLENLDNSEKVTKVDIDLQKSSIKKLSVLFEKKKKEKKIFEQTLEEYKIKLRKISSVKKDFPIKELEERYQKQQDIENIILELKHEHETDLTDLEVKEASLVRLKEVPCGDKFPTCKFIKNSHENKKILPLKREQAENKLKKINILCDSLEEMMTEKIVSKIENYQKLLKREASLDIQISKDAVYLDRLNLEIESLEENVYDLKFELIDMKRNICNENSSKNVEKLKKIIYEENDSVNELDASRMSLAQNRGEVMKDLNTLSEERKKYSKLRSQWKVYDAFMKAVSKNGIPAQIIRSQLPTINSEIEKILNGVVEFKVEIDVDPNSNAMDVYIDYGDSRRIIELASGMEKMISSLAIRVALLNTSSLPKTDLLILDEGFGSLDENSVEACNRLLTALKKWFKNILVITHVDSVKDVADNIIEIEKEGVDSKIVVE